MTFPVNDTKNAHDYLLKIGEIVVQFARVTRAPRLPDGARETDVEHSFHLALSATELAATYFPELDTGVVAQFGLVHDLPEVYSGDVWTFGISDEDRAKKEQAEREATEKLLHELPPYMSQLLARYESQKEPEAVFVRFVDKFLPAIINFWSKEAGTFLDDYDGHDRVQLHARTQQWLAELKAKFPDYPFLHDVLEMIDASSEESVYAHAAKSTSTYLNSETSSQPVQ